MHSYVRRLRTLLGTPYEADRRRFIGYIALISVWQATPLVGAVLVRVLVDAVRERDVGTARIAVALLAVVGAAGFVAARARSRTVHVLIEKCTELYDRKIMSLCTRAEGIEHLENQAFLDRIEQLRYEPAMLGLNGPQSSVIIWGSVQAALIVIVLATVHPLLLLLIAASVPSLIASRRAEAIRQRAFEAASPLRRHANHFFALATDARHADELRTLRIADALVEREQHAWNEADALMRTAEARAAVVATMGRVLFAAAYAAIIGFVVREGILGRITIGQVVLTVVLAALVNQQVIVIVDSVSRMLSAFVMVDRYHWLADYVSSNAPSGNLAAVPETLSDGIRLESVSFRYPDSARDALHDISVHLPAGSTVAVVGENGAGKTTLVKLLTAMYRQTSGVILVDGVDLASIDTERWRETTTVTFQSFARFELLLGESIGVGDLAYVNDHDRIGRASRRAGATTLAEHLGAGLDTPLGTSFEDGITLSGGQWQQVALSRSMMREQPLLVVFDEPASSLDPNAERELFERYASHGNALRHRGSVTLLVTHRFATVRSADLIVVLVDNAIAEVGNHDELMGRGGVYAELYQLQAAQYR